MENKTYISFWDKFNTKLYAKLLKSRAEPQVISTYKMGETLARDVRNKLKDDPSNINRSDIIQMALIDYAYKKEIKK